MSKKKKRIIIIIAVLLICIAVAVVFSIRNLGKTQENQLSGNGDVSTEETAGVDNSGQGISENESSVSGSTEEQGYAGVTTEESEQLIAESGSTAEGNKSTGGTSNSNTSQMTESTATQATTTRAPGTMEQPAGENPGSGNGNTHQHTWEAQYRTIHHNEKGHYEDVCVQKAYDEPVYESRYICNYCNQAFGRDEMSHFAICGPPYPEDHPLHDQFATQGSSYHIDKIQVDTIHHDAVYEKKWIVDKKAYDEQIQNGYKCTTCGAIRNN